MRTVGQQVGQITGKRSNGPPALKPVVTSQLAAFSQNARATLYLELDDRLDIAACNPLFETLLGNDLPLRGQRLEAFLAAESRGALAEIVAARLPCGSLTFRASTGEDLSFLCHFLYGEGAILLVGERPFLSTGQLVVEISRLNAQLVNQTRELQQKVHQLEQARAEIDQLVDLLPICAWCKKVRSDEGYWKTLEGYLLERHNVRTTHGICPECMEKYMSER